MDLEKLKILIAGQVLTSRTETVGDYFKDRAKCLGVIGISNPYAIKGLARGTLYEDGETKKEFSLLSIQLKGIYWISQILMGPVFFIYVFSMLKAVLRFKKKFDLFIGIACFSTLFGLLLKKLGIVKHVIYYTLDYYPLPSKFGVNTLINRTIWCLDKYCCCHAGLVWNITPRIADAREKLMNFSRDKYNHITVPLTYREKLLRFKPLSEIEEDTLVFVGTLSNSQGLQLVVEAMPELIKLKPSIKIRVIGKGFDGQAIKDMVKKRGLDEQFIFHGFIEKEEEMLEIISRASVGICPWTNEADNNVIYADPGKPKIYAFCGIPIIITRVTAIAWEIEKDEAGIAIDYDVRQFIDAVMKILKDKHTLQRYRKKSYSFASQYTTEVVFEEATKKVLNTIAK